MKHLLKISLQCLSGLFLILLVSCNSSSNKPQETPQQTESTGQIVDNYVNRLATAPDKAKKAVEAENARTEQINKAVQDMEKE